MVDVGSDGYRVSIRWLVQGRQRRVGHERLYEVSSLQVQVSGMLSSSKTDRMSHLILSFPRARQRLPGQPPIPRRSDVLDTAQAAEMGSIILGKAPEPASEADDVLMI